MSVTVGSTTPSINAAMQPGGTITGTVTDTSSPTPNDLQGICVSASQSGGGPGYGSAITASGGTYWSPIGPAGRLLQRPVLHGCGNSGNYGTQWYDNETSYASANPVSVTVGSTTPSINAAMQPGGTITGTVTDTSSPTPNDLQGICVNVYSAGGGPSPSVKNTATAANGTYTLSGLAAGSYDVQFSTGCGNAGNYLTQWYDNESSQASANPVSVTAGGTTASIDAAMAQGGTITGTVTAAVGGAALGGICVYASQSGGGLGFGSAATASNGTYSVTGLAAGSYNVQFYAATGCVELRQLRHPVVRQ